MGRFILIVVLAGLTTPGGSPQVAQEPTDADWEWFSKFRTQALDTLMPMEERGALVAYRSHHDLNHSVMEQYFTVSFASSPRGFDLDRLSASVVVPVGRSIQLQLLQLHMAERAASFESLLPRIAVRRVALETATCKVLPDRMDRLSKVRISLPRRDRIHLPMHRVWHRTVVDLWGRIDANLGDPDSPLARWSMDMMNALLACDARRSGSSQPELVH